VNLDELPDLLTPAEVASLFRVDPRTVVRWWKVGKLTARRTVGGHRRYDRGSVVALLAEADAPEDGPRHLRYPHGGVGMACHACSVAAGEPVAWPDCKAAA
jgi:excisionase family DNA binding protein